MTTFTVVRLRPRRIAARPTATPGAPQKPRALVRKTLSLKAFSATERMDDVQQV